jgi:carbamoyltransferase
MYIIGISAFYHDSSVCLFRDNQLIFACEEEKFTGIKHDRSFPEMALEYIYKNYKITDKNLQSVCYYEDPKLKYERVMENIKPQMFKNPIYCLKSFLKIRNVAKEVDERLKKLSPNVFYSTHHEAHLYYSYYTSSFEEAMCLSVDGVGEKDTMSYGFADYNGIKYQSMAKYPHSLGLYYSAMTSFLGFRPNEGEYKVMGLASYGNPETYIEKVRELISFKNGGLKCNMDIFCWDRSDKIMFNEKLPELLGVEQRLPEETLTTIHEDLAAAVQKRYEEVLFDVLKTLSLIKKSDNLCLSGGCAYNGTANGKISTDSHFNSLWIPPAPSDAGSAIGAVVHYLVQERKIKSKITRNPFLGPQYFYNDIQKALKGRHFKKFNTEKGLRVFVAKKLNEGKVVGWFQGHIEFGSRALGNRSILANPTLDGMKDRINKVIKKREGFRPFAPMVTKEKQHEYFEMTDDVPYMNQVVKVKKDYRDVLKAVTHVDGSARVQTVYKHTLIYDLLKEFEQVSGYPILLNTSFNVKDKTMVLTPKDAVETFYDTDMDILVMGNYVITKQQ